jgi:hypothetical protein
MWLLVGAVAWGADPVGYWHPDDLAGLSGLYASSSEQLQAPFGARNQELERAAAAIREYRVALDLLGDRAPAAERARLEALEAAHAENHAATQRFAGQLVEDYDRAFTAAVERAAAAVGVVAQCEGEIPLPSSGPRIPGSPRKTMPNPACVGRNLNADLAKAVDADSAANTAIGAIVARPWPALAPVAVEAQPVVGEGERWLRVVDVLRAGARGALTALDRQDDDAREVVEAAMEQATTEAELQALVPKVEAIEAETAAARAALAAPILAVAEARMAKWKGEPTTAWCANPSALGGCSGADAGVDVLAKLVADKKVAAAFPAP